MTQLLRTFRVLMDNWGSAVVALLLAFGIWIVAVNEQAPPREDIFPTKIPIEVVNLPANLVLFQEIEGAVLVKVRAPQSSWEQLTLRSFRALVDLAGLGAGLRDVPVIVQVADPQVTVLERDPPTVSVRLEPSKQKELPVQVNLLDSPPLGYVTRATTVTPARVTVSGPQSAVERVTEVVADVPLRGAKSDVEREVTLVARDTRGNGVENVKIAPATTLVQVDIEQQVGFKDVAVKVVTRGAVAAGYWISNIAVEPSTVTVVGSPAALEKVGGFVATEAIDVKDAKQQILKRVGLIVPQGASVLGEPSALVRVDVTAILGGQTVVRRPIVRGLGPGLRATMSPETVELILSGPLPDLQSLKVDDVQVIVDLVNKGTGVHKITPTLVVPTTLKVESVVPGAIEVVISSSK